VKIKKEGRRRYGEVWKERRNTIIFYGGLTFIEMV